MFAISQYISILAINHYLHARHGNSQLYHLTVNMEWRKRSWVVVIKFAATSGVIVDLKRRLVISSIAPLSPAIFLYM